MQQLNRAICIIVHDQRRNIGSFELLFALTSRDEGARKYNRNQGAQKTRPSNRKRRVMTRATMLTSVSRPLPARGVCFGHERSRSPGFEAVTARLPKSKTQWR